MAKFSQRTHNAEVRDPLEPSDDRQHVRNGNCQPDDVTSCPISDEVKAQVPENKLPRMESRKEFAFPGVLAMVPESREQVMEFVEQHCDNESDRLDLFVAIQEALANAALHGCKDDPAQRIQCVAMANGDEITVTVRDPGPGFDLELADPDRYEPTKLTHGRGIRLMHSLMSSVSFARRGAEVTLRKRLKSARNGME